MPAFAPPAPDEIESDGFSPPGPDEYISESKFTPPAPDEFETRHVSEIEPTPVASRIAAKVGSGLEKGMSMPERAIRGGLDFLGYYGALDAVLGTGTKYQDYNKSWLDYYNRRDRQLAKEDADLGATGFGYDVVEGVSRAAVEMPTQLLGGAAGAARNAAIKASAITAGATAGLTQYAQDRGDDKGKLEAASYAALSGAITGLTTAAFGATGVESVFKSEGVKGVGKRILNVLKEAGFEGAEEATDQFQQDLLERATKNPDKPIADSVRDVLLAGSIGSVIGGAANLLGVLKPNAAQEMVKAADAPMTATQIEGINLPELNAALLESPTAPLTAAAVDEGGEMPRYTTEFPIAEIKTGGPNAVQIESANAEVLRQQESQMGLPQVGERNAQPEVAAAAQVKVAPQENEVLRENVAPSAEITSAEKPKEPETAAESPVTTLTGEQTTPPPTREQAPTTKPWTIRGEKFSKGDQIHWMSGGTWDGIVVDAIKNPSGKHDVTVRDTNGETFTLKGAEDYGIAKGASRFITEENKPSYPGWESDYPDLQKPKSKSDDSISRLSEQSGLGAGAAPSTGKIAPAEKPVGPAPTTNAKSKPEELVVEPVVQESLTTEPVRAVAEWKPSPMPPDVFLGNLEGGTEFGGFNVLGNFRKKADADAASASNSGTRVEGYLDGKYKRGWVVLQDKAAASPKPTAPVAKSQGQEVPVKPSVTVTEAKVNPFDTSVTGAKLTELDKSRPRPTDKLYGKSGGTPELRAENDKKVRQWTSARAKAVREHRAMVEKSNQWIADNKPTPPTEPTATGKVAEEPSATKRALTAVEGLQKRLRGSGRTNLDIPRWIASAAVDAIWVALKAGDLLSVAIDKGVAKAKQLMAGRAFNEADFRAAIEAEISSPERRESQGTFLGGYESTSRIKQAADAEAFRKGKTTEQVLDDVSLLAGGKSVPGLSMETIPAVLAATMSDIGAKLAATTNPVEFADLNDQLDRAKELAQKAGSNTGQQLQAQKTYQDRLQHLAPYLTLRGLIRRGWERALKIKPTAEGRGGIGPIVADSGKKASEAVNADDINASAELKKALREAGIKLSTLFLDNPHATQKERREHLFKQIQEKFPNLNAEQRTKLEKALSEAWEEARLRIFRQQFKKYVGLPEVRAENILDEAQPELIRQANLGTLTDESFHDAIAKVLGLPSLSGTQAIKMIQLAQEAQAAPAGILKNKKLAEMVDLLNQTNQFHPFDIWRDYWYANALSGTRTWVNVLSSVIHGLDLVKSRTIDLAARGKFKAAVAVPSAWTLDLVEGIANAIDLVAHGDYTRRAEYGQNVSALLAGKGRLDTLEGMLKRGNKAWKRALGMTAFSRRMIVGLDYVSAISTRGSEIIYGAALSNDADQLEHSLRRFNREAAKQAKQQAKVELGPGAKWVDVRARQLEILNEGVSEAVISQAMLMGEIVALNAPLVGVTGAIHSGVNAGLRSIGSSLSDDPKTSEAIATGIHFVMGSAFLRAMLNMVANATNYMPGVGAVNYARSFIPAGTSNAKIGKVMRMLAMLDDEGKPMSQQRRQMILSAQLTGLGMAAGVLALAMKYGDSDDEEERKKFDITGAWKGMDWRERKARMDAGQRPNSILYRGNYYSYANQPMAGALVLIGNLRDEARQKGPAKSAAELYDHLAATWWMMPLYVKDISMISGMANVMGMAATKADESAAFSRLLQQEARTAITGTIPFSSLVSEIDSWFDPKIYKPETWQQFMLSAIPWMRESAGYGPNYNMAGIPVESPRTPQSRVVANKQFDPVLEQLGKLVERGIVPKIPVTPQWIKGGETFTPNQKPELTYRHQTETLKEWRKEYAAEGDSLGKMTKEEYDDYYEKYLLPISREIHSEIQDELDPDVLERTKRGVKTRKDYELKPKKFVREP